MRPYRVGWIEEPLPPGASLEGYLFPETHAFMEQLRQLEARVTTVDPSLGGNDVFRDPERLGEAGGLGSR